MSDHGDPHPNNLAFLEIANPSSASLNSPNQWHGGQQSGQGSGSSGATSHASKNAKKKKKNPSTVEVRKSKASKK